MRSGGSLFPRLFGTYAGRRLLTRAALLSFFVVFVPVVVSPALHWAPFGLTFSLLVFRRDFSEFWDDRGEGATAGGDPPHLCV